MMASSLGHCLSFHSRAAFISRGRSGAAASDRKASAGLSRAALLPSTGWSRLGRELTEALRAGASTRIANGERLGVLPGCSKTEIGGREQRAVGHDDGAFYAVLKLAHVSGPRMISERGERSGPETTRQAAVFGGKPVEKKARQHDHVSGSLTQRWNLHCNLV